MGFGQIESTSGTGGLTDCRSPVATKYGGRNLIVDGDIVNSSEISDLCLPGVNPNVEQRDPAVSMSWRHQAQRLQREAHVFYFVFKHPRTHWYARLVAVCTAGYLFSPIQLIPSFIPVIGFLDDLLVLFLGVKLLQRITPPDVLTECRELAKAAEMRRKEEIRSSAAVVASAAIVTLWLLATVTASALVAAYIPH
jgi:uncharacterized membrane protein YkvA (DUF1232 family)